VTLRNVTPGTQVLVFDSRNIYPGLEPVIPTSPFNVITQGGSNNPVTYTIQPDRLLDSFSVSRPAIRAGVTGIALPEWSLTAFDEFDNPIGSVGEGQRSIFSDIIARTFTLNGRIAYIRFNSNSYNFAAFSSMPLDNWNLSPDRAVPEPASVVVFGLGLAGMVGVALRRRMTRSVDAGVPDPSDA
jgi:hypothetical protein